MKVYLDHNVLVGIAGHPRWPDADVELMRLVNLAHSGVQWVVSSMHVYELARSGDDENVREYCELVELMRPTWANNPLAVRRDELRRFLAKLNDVPTQGLSNVRPFSDTLAQMWASYSGVVFINDTFTKAVQCQRTNPQIRSAIEQAARQTAESISTCRRAQREGHLKAIDPTVNAQLFAGLIGCDIADPRVPQLVSRIGEVHAACRMLAVEDVLSDVRAKDSFRPKESHAPDFQHALSALSYCDGFVADDKNLLEHCRIVVNKLGLARQLVKRIGDLVVLPGSQGGVKGPASSA